MIAPRDLGFLLTTEHEQVDLGTHHGHHLLGRTEQRRLRIALGRGGGLRLALTRARAVALDVTDRAGRSERLALDVPPDPWLAAARRVLWLWLLSLAVTTALRPPRGAPHPGRNDASA